MSEKTTEKLSSIRYWSGQAIKHLPEMRLAKETGLFPKKEGWRNVVEHELVEAEAADVLAEVLNLSSTDRQNVYTACSVHDLEKRRETELIRKVGPSGYELSQQEQADLLRSRGYSEEVIKLTQSVGGMFLPAMLKNSKSPKLEIKDDLSLPTMIVHYVDDITLNNDIVPLRERIDYLESNPRYKEANEQGRALFGGRTYTQVEWEVGRLLEEKLAQMLGVKPSSRLPNFIKTKIQERIEAHNLSEQG